MNRRTTKAVTISLPPEMVDELDRVRKQEHRTRSELLGEALRQYVSGRTRQIPVVDPERGELEAMQRGREAIARGQYVMRDDLLDEMGIDR